MSERILVGAGAGYSGDRLDASIAVVGNLCASGERAAIIFETLGERTLALAQLRRKQNPRLGYEPKLKELLTPVLKECVDSGVTVLGNFGAANPIAASDVIAEVGIEVGVRPRIGIITGDDMLSPEGLEVLRACCDNLPDSKLLASANVYLGAEPIVEALNEGAQVVVTGRVADPSLTLGPVIHAFGWSFQDWPRLGRATMAGHLLECGAQVTGGYFADPGFKDVPGPERIGYPIAEIDRDGNFFIGKATGGGLVNRRTVTEQLLYELHDPAEYLTPDVIADISNAELTELPGDRVHVDGVTGRPRSQTLKVTVCYDGGWLGEGEISYYGPNALARARLAGEIVKRRSPRSLRIRCDVIGVLSVLADDSGRAWDSVSNPPGQDLRLRLAFAGPDRNLVERGLAEVEALYCAGPAAGGGIRVALRPRISAISCFVPRSAICPKVEIRESRSC
ncbi:acyclic terpene utilization AtuA family protein [Bradyrhizobium sp. ARR65]|uniref:acyclic terpene utilization AtuA family protein n=1 Tax=Bradyrhizobium sp. ARR65 TaxID=1040989 RepID=UPI000465C10C|nr:acyclic terpene utilization AtuA family protein [Bradyrhizobium sp. ARR65]